MLIVIFCFEDKEIELEMLRKVAHCHIAESKWKALGLGIIRFDQGAFLPSYNFIFVDSI